MILSVNVSYDACIYMYIPKWAKNRKNVEMNDVFQNSYSRTGTSSAITVILACLPKIQRFFRNSPALLPDLHVSHMYT